MGLSPFLSVEFNDISAQILLELSKLSQTLKHLSGVQELLVDVGSLHTKHTEIESRNPK